MEPVYQKRVKLYHHKCLGSASHENDVLFMYDDLLHRTMFVVENEEEANRKKGKILQVELFIRAKQATL